MDLTRLETLLDLGEQFIDRVMFKSKNIPGYTLDIGGIPTAVTETHAEVFYYWQNSGLEGAVLLHIDGHADMDSSAPSRRKVTDLYYNHLYISSFICPAVHYGIVSSIYWLNPHSKKRKLQFMGALDREEEGVRIGTKVIRGMIFWEYPEGSKYTKYGIGKVITPAEILLNNRVFILDIDLDAFCGEYSIEHVSSRYDGVSGWEQRVDQTVNFLAKLKRPDLITITRSQGNESYVPEDKVDTVQDLLMQELRELYKPIFS